MDVYIASKVKHAPKWRRLRDELSDGHVQIISTWIDEAGPGETTDRGDLALRCIQEASEADILILYAEEGDFLKGALVECGAALAFNRQVWAVGPVLGINSAFRSHPNWHEYATVEMALAVILHYGSDQ